MFGKELSRRAATSALTFTTSLIRFQPGSHGKLLADATHRCRASIRTLNGPLLGPVHFGVRSKSQVHHHCDGPGDCWGLPSNLRSCGPRAYTQSPEQGGGCRCLQNFLDSYWFSRHQRMSAPWSCLVQQSLRLVLGSC